MVERMTYDEIKQNIINGSLDIMTLFNDCIFNFLAKCTDTFVIEQMIEKYPENLKKMMDYYHSDDFHNSGHDTYLLVAVSTSNKKFIDLLLNFDRERLLTLLDVTGYYNITPLHKICENSDIDLLNLFLSIDPGKIRSCINIKYVKNTPIYILCRNNKLNMLKLLIECDRKFDSELSYIKECINIRCLYAICYRGHKDIFTLLYDIATIIVCNTMKCMYIGHHSNTCLHILCENKHYEFIKLLISYDENIVLDHMSATNDFLRTPVHDLFDSYDENEIINIVSLFIELSKTKFEECLNMLDLSGNNPIMLLCTFNCKHVLKYLMPMFENSVIKALNVYNDLNVNCFDAVNDLEMYNYIKPYFLLKNIPVINPDVKDMDNNYIVCDICLILVKNCALYCGHRFCIKCISTIYINAMDKKDETHEEPKCPFCKIAFNKDTLIQLY